MGRRRLKAYSGTCVEGTVLVRFHDSLISRFQIHSVSGAVVMDNIVVRYQGGSDRLQEWTSSQTDSCWLALEARCSRCTFAGRKICG